MIGDNQNEFMDGWITLEGFKGNYTLKTSRGNASFVLKEDRTDTLMLSE